MRITTRALRVLVRERRDFTDDELGELGELCVFVLGAFTLVDFGLSVEEGGDRFRDPVGDMGVLLDATGDADGSKDRLSAIRND